MEASSFHQVPGLFGLQSYFWTPDTFFFFFKTKKCEKPDEFLSELKLDEFTAQENGAGN